jgi:hypothetical protein
LQSDCYCEEIGDGDVMVMGLVAGFPLLRVDGDVMMRGLIVLAGGAVV